MEHGEIPINPRVIRWFETRALDPELVVRMGIYSGKHTASGVEASADGDVIVFPFIKHGVEVGAKYRGANKHFWQRPGGDKTFWNADALSDPSLATGMIPLVITEGEIDCITAVQCGFPLSISVPDGAPPESYVSKIDDPEHDQKFSYVAAEWDALKLVKRIIIAVDNDRPGRKLAEELVRRLGRVRCHWVEYPDGCKDLNDVLMKVGADRVTEVLSAPKPYPIRGLYRLSEFPDEPLLEPMTTGWSRLDDRIKVCFPCFMVVTGFAGSGKSTWSNQLVAQLAILHGWRSAIASFEMRLRPFVTDTLRSVYLEHVKRGPYPRRSWTREDCDRADAWIEQQFAFIAPGRDEEEDHDINWLIERAAASVIRFGTRAVLIDPWNEIEHLRRRDESATDYTGRAIRELKRFAHDFDVLVIVVAHPTKAAHGKDPTNVSLYDVADSAHFANKADLGVVIARRVDEGGEATTETMVLVRKVRFQPECGAPGGVTLIYDTTTRTFSQ